MAEKIEYLQGELQRANSKGSDKSFTYMSVKDKRLNNPNSKYGVSKQTNSAQNKSMDWFKVNPVNKPRKTRFRNEGNPLVSVDTNADTVKMSTTTARYGRLMKNQVNAN